MRSSLNRFALCYLAAVVLGLCLLLLRGRGGLLAPLAPRCPSPWELSKLAFWPLLAACALLGRMGRGRRPLLRDLPAAVLAPVGMTLISWGVLAAGGRGTLCLAVWAGCAAAALAFGPDGERKKRLWLALVLALAGAYVLLSWRAPDWGPFAASLG